MTKRRSIAALIVLLVAVLAAFLWYRTHEAPPAFTLDSRDATIADWSFAGTYASDPQLAAKVQANIARLMSASSTKAYAPYDRYASLAQDYDLLGDGKNEYAYLLKAIAAGGQGASAAWENLGILLARFGAYYSARTALENAITATPNVGVYREAYVRFLMAHFPDDHAAIAAAFTDGLANNLDPNLYPDEAGWLASVGSTTEAIAAWKAYEAFVPARQLPSIEAQITKLRAQ